MERKDIVRGLATVRDTIDMFGIDREQAGKSGGRTPADIERDLVKVLDAMRTAISNNQIEDTTTETMGEAITAAALRLAKLSQARNKSTPEQQSLYVGFAWEFLYAVINAERVVVLDSEATPPFQMDLDRWIDVIISNWR
jgi:hypothetical protein